MLLLQTLNTCYKNSNDKQTKSPLLHTFWRNRSVSSSEVVVVNKVPVYLCYVNRKPAKYSLLTPETVHTKNLSVSGLAVRNSAHRCL